MAGQRNGRGKRSGSLSDHADKGGSKRRNSGDDRDLVIEHDNTVYRYLCPARRIGSIIGRGGEIAKQLRADTKSKINIGDTVSGCDERVITIYSPSDETNEFEDTDSLVCPAQDALFKVHEKVVADTLVRDGDSDNESESVVARLLVPSDQIGSVIGKGGNVIQNIRSESGAQVRIMKDDYLPSCALRTDELIQISGEPSLVKKALIQIAIRLHENPSRAQHMLSFGFPVPLQAGAQFMGPASVAPIMSLPPLVGQYGGYKADTLDWPQPIYQSSRGDGYSKEFSLRLVCLVENVGGVIGKNGVIINQIRQESGATVNVDSSTAEGDDCLITISAKEVFEDSFSPVVEAAVRLQPRCSDRNKRDSGIISFTTRLLISSSRIGCLIGRGGSVINEMRRVTKANIRILPKESLPKIASDEDELVQISGDLEICKCALIHMATRLRANVFDREASAFVPVIPYLPTSDRSDGSREDRDGRKRGRGSYTDGYGGPNDLASSDGYGSYGTSQLGGAGGGYGLSSDYSTGRTSSYGLSGHNSISRRKSYDY